MYKLIETIGRLTEFSNSLADLPKDTEQVRCFATTENFDTLKKFTNLKHLFLTNGGSAELLARSEIGLKTEALALYNFQVNDLSPLGRLAQLKYLVLEWNNRSVDLWDLSTLRNLKGLAIRDFKNLATVQKLETCPWIEELSLNGGMWNKLKIHSLEPLSSLTNLKFLSLTNIAVKEKGLSPLQNLTQLKELELSSQFETKEYAELSVRLPNTRCNMFSHFVKLGSPIGDLDVMVVGRRKPFLNSVRDKQKLEKFAEKFKEFQEGAKRA